MKPLKLPLTEPRSGFEWVKITSPAGLDETRARDRLSLLEADFFLRHLPARIARVSNGDFGELGVYCEHPSAGEVCFVAEVPVAKVDQVAVFGLLQLHGFVFPSKYGPDVIEQEVRGNLRRHHLVQVTQAGAV